MERRGLIQKANTVSLAYQRTGNTLESHAKAAVHRLQLPGCSAGLTGLPGALQEGVHGAAVAMAALRGHGGDVAPLQCLQQRHHGLGLGSVRSNHPREEVVAPLVAQLRCRGAVAHLRDLQGAESQGQSGQEQEVPHRHLKMRGCGAKNLNINKSER